LSLHGQVIEERVVAIRDPIRIGEHPDAVVGFPGADILISCVDGDICWRGRRLREGDRATLEVGNLLVEVEHLWPERIRYSRPFGGVDFAFGLLLLGVMVTGLWVDTFNRVNQVNTRGNYLAEIGEYREEFSRNRVWLAEPVRSSAVQATETEATTQAPIWDGPQSGSDDYRTGFSYYSWYRNAIDVPAVSVRDIRQGGLSVVDHASLAESAYAADNYVAALAHYHWLVEKIPEEPRWLEGIAEVQNRLGMHRLALENWEALLDIEPHNIVALSKRPVTLARLGRLDAAGDALGDLHEAHPSHPYSDQATALVKAIQGLELEALAALWSVMEEFGALPIKMRSEIRRDIALDPAFAILRADPRLRQLLEDCIQDAPRPI